MALPYAFSAVTEANTSWLDSNFQAVGIMGTIPCTVAGTDALVFTQAVNTPTIAAYANYERFSGIVAVDNTTAVTARIGSLPILSVYKDTTSGPIALTGGELQAGNVVILTYDSALNSGAGGFHVSTPVSGAGTGTVTSIATGAGLTGGTITAAGTIALAAIANLRLLANISGGSLAPSANTLTAILDAILGTTVGGVPVRGASWLSVTPGANALPLQSVTGGGGAAYGGVVSTTVSATGSVQGDAAAIGSCNLCVLTTVGAATGAILPVTTGNPLIHVLNRGANNLSVYPQVGSQIEGLGANNPDTVVATTGNAAYMPVSSTLWRRVVAS